MIVPHRKFAPAIQLIIKTILLQQLVSALLQAAFAPVFCPIGHIIINTADGILARLVDLRKAFPTRRCQGSREHIESVLDGVLCCAQKSVFEAYKASLATLGLSGKRLCGLQPLVVIVVIIDDVEP